MPALPEGFRILPSGRVQWRVMIHHRRISGTADTLTDARRQRSQAILDAGLRPTDTPTVSDAIAIYTSSVEQSAATGVTQAWALTKLPAAFLDRAVDDVDATVAAALWRQLDTAGISRHAQRKAANLLGRTWRMAIEWGWTTYSPWLAVKPKAPPPPDAIHPPTPEQVVAVISHAPTPDLGDYWTLSSRTGARTGELAALRFDDVLPGGLAIRRNITRAGEMRDTKTGTKGHRVIPIDSHVERLLERRRRPGVPWIFADRYGDPWRPDRAGLAFRRVADAVGVDASIHDLRHFCATQWLAAGVPLPTVSALLGHSNVTTTLNTYAHWVPAQGREAVEALGALLDAQSLGMAVPSSG